MRSPVATLAPTALVVPAGLLHLLPVWAVLVVVGTGVALTAAQVIVTQIIRLTVLARITNSHDAVQVLQIEDLPHGHSGATPSISWGGDRAPRRGAAANPSKPKRPVARPRSKPPSQPRWST